MKIKFENDQKYQLDAINSVVNLFKGQSSNSTIFDGRGMANFLNIEKKVLLENLQKIQSTNQVEQSDWSDQIEQIQYYDEELAKKVKAEFYDFSIEMETGTGKTYVYIRTIFELNKIYGFQKFIIVVPSIAIKEGVYKNLQITSAHFQEIYNRVQVNFSVYDSGKLINLYNFYRSNTIQILVMNIDSFAKDQNIINKVNESGSAPVQSIQNSRPIVIIDEPQNMETDLRKKAIVNLNPIFTLRYSATHKNIYNLIYKLDPVMAYDKGLVKQIEVDSIYSSVADEGLTEIVMRKMIDTTIENHFKKEKELKNKGIKVLSLFFIDRVNNYRVFDHNGKSSYGKFAYWFEESFNKWIKRPEFSDLYDFDASKAHDGYFSQDPKGRYKNSNENRLTKADNDTFSLIMKHKELLLDPLTPLRFIFSHSALREGWDNPNVFNICTLNETNSEIKKRQEIGRGLRLCVNSNGERVRDPEFNRLTIIANEAYDKFANSLQKEIEKDCGVLFQGRIKNAREKERIRLKDNWNNDSFFIEIWQKIRNQSIINFNFDTDELLQNCIISLQGLKTLSKIQIIQAHNKTKFLRNKEGLPLKVGSNSSVENKEEVDHHFTIPNLVSSIQEKTGITKESIGKILLQYKRIEDAFINPSQFIEEVSIVITEQHEKLKYSGTQAIFNVVEQEDSIFYELERDYYKTNLFKVNNPQKTLTNWIYIDSIQLLERKFAEDCQQNEKVLYYLKLPKSFRFVQFLELNISTWCVLVAIKENLKKIFVVTLNVEFKEHQEKMFKSHCESIKDLHYKNISELKELFS
jgi:restriction endonuclease